MPHNSGRDFHNCFTRNAQCSAYVVVYTAEDPAETVVAALGPVEALSLSGNEAVQPIAREVRERLQRVLKQIAE
jgi:hypothetical protein